MLGAAKWLVRALEALLRPRFSEWVENGIFRHGCGVIIFVCGLLLMLPLPIPLTNGLPAPTIVLLAGARRRVDDCRTAGIRADAVPVRVTDPGVVQKRSVG